ncbi:MAG TPA: N-acetyl-gamma-glutamyl-phosphate reductase [Armatimonadota bacterium]|nr:N-acetyl-gamma-glutamyl-phosphate reductase [Armatimonadota bacterium]HPP74366.1 N-acetyl-gamma-glutamyl-phosphate reductase [Armatimonadota bacterium]
MIKVGIIGASGYAGGELIRYLTGHPEAKIAYLASDTYKGKHISSAFPSLTGQDLPVCESFNGDAADRADVFFLAQHNGWAMNIAPKLLDAGKKVIDISADFRFRAPEVYEQWYKTEHKAKDETRSAVYGLSEFKKAAIASANLVGNPGCYPTGALTAVLPAVSAGLIDPAGIIIDSKSGVSGAGRTKTEISYLFSELDESLKPYNVGVHRHTPEIEQEVSEVAGRAVKLNFTPHLVPMIRGILTTAYAPLVRDVTTSAAIHIYRELYTDSAFVTVLDEGEYPVTKYVSGSNYCHIGLKADNRTGRLIMMSAIDNMGKGAAGQAVQNMNIMFGLPESTGLNRPAVYP